MSQKKLTVGDVFDVVDFLNRAREKANGEENAKIDELIEKLKAMETRS